MKVRDRLFSKGFSLQQDRSSYCVIRKGAKACDYVANEVNAH